MQAPPLSSEMINRCERVRIVGQGLVGTLLALKLDERNIPFVVQSANMDGAATVVAPGIVNPLAGKSFRPPDNLPYLMEEVQLAMNLIEEKLGERIWKSCPILRVFSEPVQIDRYKKGLTETERANYIAAEYPENTFSELNDVFGSFLTKGGGWANLPLLVATAQAWLLETDRFIEEEWDPGSEDAPLENELTIFCEGWQVSKNRHWSFIPHNPAKGEMLIVRFEEDLPRDRIYNQSCWIQPLDGDLWRVGATYSWSEFGSTPSLQGASDLQDKLHLLTSIPFHVEDQLAGVRPIVEDYRPVVGQHPQHKNWFILNAMGSKGVLQAPAAASALMNLLVDGREIPKRWAVTRFC